MSTKCRHVGGSQNLGGLTLKTRIVSALALAAAITLGATGCSLFAHESTLHPYAPSDGVETTVDGVGVRNLLLVADESGENFNVVFTGVNNTESPADIRINFVDQGSQQASAQFRVTPGTTAFGDLGLGSDAQFVSLPGVIAGSTVSAYIQLAGANEVELQVPVLDGTLDEYKPFVG